MKKIDKDTEIELARRFFTEVGNVLEDDMDDSVYEVVDPECEYGDRLCKILNNDTVHEVLKLGFKAKYGVDMVGCDS